MLNGSSDVSTVEKCWRQHLSCDHHSCSPSPLPFLRVKPAIFDLLLAVCIAAYLGTMYLAIQASCPASSHTHIHGCETCFITCFRIWNKAQTCTDHRSAWISLMRLTLLLFSLFQACNLIGCSSCAGVQMLNRVNILFSPSACSQNFGLLYGVVRRVIQPKTKAH